MKTHTFLTLLILSPLILFADRQLGPDPIARRYTLGGARSAPLPAVPPPAPSPYPPQPALIVIDSEEGELRVINGEVVNVSNLPGWRRFSAVRLSQGVGTAEALIDDDGTTYHITNIPGLNGKPDGTILSFYAQRRSSLYEYTTVLGAGKRVASYDLGEWPTEQQIRARQAQRQSENAKLNETLQTQWKEQVKRIAEQIRTTQAAKAKETDSRVLASQMRNASNGMGYAQYELGVRYLKGDGVSTNLNLALQWLRAACTNGYSQASNKLATLRGVTSN